MSLQKKFTPDWLPRWRVAVLAFTFLPIQVFAVSVTSYETIDLPETHSAVYPLFMVTGVSDEGAVIVGKFRIDDGNIYSGAGHSFIWENDTLIHPIDLGLSGVVSAGAADVSADGTAIVGTLTTDAGVKEAYRLQNGEVTRLGFLPGATESRASAVSADGSVIVGISGSSGEDIAFRWEDGLMTSLGELPGGEVGSWAKEVSPDGSIVVGYSSSSLGMMEAFRWENDILTGLNLGIFFGIDVSADGSVIVGGQADSPLVTAIRLKDGEITYLAPSDETPSGALSVSPDGSLVTGYSGWIWAGGDAAIWSQEDNWETHYLDTLVDNAGYDREGYHLFDPITSDGSTVVGHAIRFQGGEKLMRLYRIHLNRSQDVSRVWGPFVVQPNGSGSDPCGWVNTKDTCGWLYLLGEPDPQTGAVWAYSESLNSCLYFCEPPVPDKPGSWVYMLQ